MNNTAESQRRDYLAPALRIVPLNVENAVCGSPLQGGNEDIGYDDWDWDD